MSRLHQNMDVLTRKHSTLLLARDNEAAESRTYYARQLRKFVGECVSVEEDQVWIASYLPVTCKYNFIHVYNYRPKEKELNGIYLYVIFVLASSVFSLLIVYFLYFSTLIG